MAGTTLLELAALTEPPTPAVIVHKVDRLARNRYDDAVISAQLQAAGARLVSVTENIDQTPSGLLLHGIMSSIAEFYSRNLANEVIKGTQQKVSAGGTPHIAPIGYRKRPRGGGRPRGPHRRALTRNGHRWCAGPLRRTPPATTR